MRRPHSERTSAAGNASALVNFFMKSVAESAISTTSVRPYFIAVTRRVRISSRASASVIVSCTSVLRRNFLAGRKMPSKSAEYWKNVSTRRLRSRISGVYVRIGCSTIGLRTSTRFRMSMLRNERSSGGGGTSSSVFAQNKGRSGGRTTITLGSAVLHSMLLAVGLGVTAAFFRMTAGFESAFVARE
ncbi:hypothetical protein BDZ88DRAFT_409990 [Geranomyces variabilis]|nr:hypothetical protein BDZ88DRAFT_409990 [Geranomyces variabilis]